MIQKIRSLFFQQITRRKQGAPPSMFLVLLLVILPLVLVALYEGVHEFDYHGRIAASAEHEEMAFSLASLVKEKLDRAVDVGVALTACPCLQNDVRDGQWEMAIENLGAVKKKLPYIDLVTLLDVSGTIRATTSGDPLVIGRNFAHRDYYKGVSKNWEPYVSEAFKKESIPKYNIVSVALPVKSGEEVFGILILSIKLDTIVGWSKYIEIGPSGFAYIVDKKGQLIAHPNVPSDNLIDYTSVPTVQKVLRGERGVEVLFNPVDNEERMTAYAPVLGYGWGVAVVQPSRVAFAERNREAVQHGAAWAAIILLVGFIVYRVVKDRMNVQAQRDRERVLLDSIGDGVVAIDRNWNITLWNHAASNLTGWQEKEAFGKPFRSIVKFLRERDRTENVTFIENAIVLGNTTEITENTILMKRDGSEIPVGDSAAPIMGPHGYADGAIIIFRDISREREDAHLHSDFAYASHQLRTPVTEALWNLETAMSEENPEKRKEDIDIVHSSLENVQKLVEHLVAVSGLDQGNVIAKVSLVKLVDLLTEVQSKLSRDAERRNITLVFAPVSPMVAVETDPVLLKKALFEVVRNAIVYSHEGGRVDVTTTIKDHVLFEIEDHGVGVPLEEQPIIFTKFFRGSNRGAKIVGAGLGLFIAREYLKLLDGKIWFTSEEGKGTTFFVSLPVK